MRTRTVRWSVSASLLVAAGLALTACDPGDSVSASVSSSGGSGSTASSRTTAATPPAAQQSSKAGGLPVPPGPADPDLRCTNQYSYAGDSRDNATINSIGSDTGTCPPVVPDQSSQAEDRPAPPGPADPDQRCTNQYNYVGDSRDNATINSLGFESGTCPPFKP
ncbi:hypothetical protein QR77_17910 [Streptomyces sp. 150FB]|nr:hypothetical protein QR77_17910 [Streptomyces sp. 150FB]